MENVNKGNRQNQENDKSRTGNPNQNQVVNAQDQSRSVNTGDEDFKENVAGRTPEDSPRDLNLNDSEKTGSADSEGGAEVETPHKHEGDDEESTERKIPKM